MYFNIATGLVTLVRNTNYKPNWVNDSPQLKDPVSSPYPDFNMAASAMTGPGHWDKAPIFRIQVAKNALGTGLVRLWLFNTAELAPVDVPYLAFTQGLCYDMHVKKYTLVTAGGVEITDKDADFILVGHLCSAMPLNL